MDAWRLAYTTLSTSRIYGTNPLPTISAVNTTIANQLATSSSIPIVMMHSKYAHVKVDAFSANLLKVENDQVKDVSGRTMSPYTLRSIFIASPTNNVSTSDNFSLIFKNELFYNTTGKTVQSLSVDFGDGRGYLTAGWNKAISGGYTTNGLIIIKIKVKFTDNSEFPLFDFLDF